MSKQCSKSSSTSLRDPSQCVVLVPAYRHIEPRCEESLRALEELGYPVRRSFGCAAIDSARNRMSTAALLDGFEETLWIDSDIIFKPEDVEQLRAHNLPFSCGIYPKKSKREMAVSFEKETHQLLFGKGGGLVELRAVGTGFLHVRREVYQGILDKLEMPLCNSHSDEPIYPFFQPMVVEGENGPEYRAEDFAFCERAQQAGYTLHADTSIRLFHVGSYDYGWEDAGRPTTRYKSFRLEVIKKPGSPKTPAEPRLGLARLGLVGALKRLGRRP